MNKRTSFILKIFLCVGCLAFLAGGIVLLTVCKNSSSRKIVIDLPPARQISAFKPDREPMPQKFKQGDKRKSKNKEDIFKETQKTADLYEEHPVQPLEADESNDAVQTSLQDFDTQERLLIQDKSDTPEEKIAADDSSLPVLTDEYLTPEPVFEFLLSPVDNDALTPRLAQENMRPIDYKRPAKLALDKPNIAVIIPNLGLQETLTQQIINSSMPEVTLAFNPQTFLFDSFLKQARAQGHETLVDLSFVRQFPKDAMQRLLDTRTAVGFFILDNKYLSHLTQNDSYLLVNSADAVLKEPFTKEAINQTLQDFTRSLPVGKRIVLIVPAIPLVVNELISFMKENSDSIHFVPASAGAF